jgi:hypothetical protein
VIYVLLFLEVVSIVPSELSVLMTYQVQFAFLLLWSVLVELVLHFSPHPDPKFCTREHPMGWSLMIVVKTRIKIFIIFLLHGTGKRLYC